MGSTSKRLAVLAATIATTAVVAGTASTPAKATVPSPSYCHFPHDHDGEHVIYYRANISCDGARAVLRRLRGHRLLIPMACRHDRHIDGWRLYNHGLEWDLIATTFTRGNVRISYQRSGRPGIQCAHVPPFESDGPS